MRKLNSAPAPVTEPLQSVPASQPDSAPASLPQPQNWKLTLAYDGTDFHGWQIQPGRPTIQGELQSALARITGESPLPQGSGRTDAGVHALAQVASFTLAAPIPAENLRRALNRTLPPAIRITETKTVRSTFHARHSAVAKTYEYRVFREPICPPTLARYVHACAWPLDFDALQSAARLFLGEHDFLSFAATDPDLAERDADDSDSLPADALNQNAKVPAATPLSPEEKSQTAIRTIYGSAWELRPTDSGLLLVYRVRGNGFLHHMVRNLVGTMLDVGRGRLPVDDIPRILAARARAAAGPTAPPTGLFLHSVEYDGADAPFPT